MNHLQAIVDSMDDTFEPGVPEDSFYDWLSSNAYPGVSRLVVRALIIRFWQTYDRDFNNNYERLVYISKCLHFNSEREFKRN